jgi:hypothetical protein
MCHEFCREYGRDPATLGLEGRLECWKRDEDRWKESVDAWIALGASHASVNTMAQGLQGVEQHLKRLEEYRAAWA